MIFTLISAKFCGLPIRGISIFTFPWWIKTFYPKPYSEIVATYSTMYDIDPLLVYSLIRRESRYQEHVESYAGAVGLMQLLPATATWLAEREGMASFREEELKQPEINIQLGCLYLSWLNDQFEGKIPVVLAAYNAGHGRVEEWLKEQVWDGEADTIEQIPFAETRTYVQDVLNNYWAYQMIEKLHGYPFYE